MKDLIDELHAMTRVVGDATLPAGEAKVVSLSRVYAADIDDVWDAITAPERIARWFLPVTGDLRLGGTYQLEGNAGGEIRVCEPPQRLVVTWIAGEPPGPEDSSIVEVRLDADGDDATRLTLEHIAVPPPGFWEQFGPGAVGIGWDLALVALSTYLAGGELGDPATLDVDPDMRAAMTASGEAWGEAYLAAGAEPEVAADVTATVVAFYVPPLDAPT